MEISQQEKNFQTFPLILIHVMSSIYFYQHLNENEIETK